MGYYKNKQHTIIWDGIGEPKENDFTPRNIVCKTTTSRILQQYLKCPKCGNLRWIEPRYKNIQCRSCRNDERITHGNCKNLSDPQHGETARGWQLNKFYEYSNNYYQSKKCFVYRICQKCGEKRWKIYNPHVKRLDLCNTCSHSENYGAKSWAFKGGREVTKDGYIRITVYPDDPIYNLLVKSRTHKCGTFKILEHRYVFTKFLNRRLYKWEHIHHINGNKQDNRLENLEIVQPKDHQIYTQLQTENENLRKQLEELHGQTNVVGVSTQVVQHSPETIL